LDSPFFTEMTVSARAIETSTAWHAGKLKDDGGSNLTEMG
jgi:hypothetical protein